MAMDIIGVMIGFVFIMLILSLMVTAISQFLQNMFRVRSRNLHNSLYFFVEEMKTKYKEELNVKIDVRQFIESYRFSPKPKSGEWGANIKSLLFYPNVSWIDSSNVIDKFYGLFDRGSAKIKSDLENNFKALERYMKKKFLRSVRFISILVAVFVTMVFQVDSLKLIKDLSTDNELRAKYVLTAEDWAKENQEKINTGTTYQEVSDAALRRLSAKYPSNAPQIEQASGEGQDVEELIDELNLILLSENVANISDISGDYRKILEEIYENRIQANRREIRALTSELAILNIAPFQHDLSYFLDLQHLIGILITIILISLGAPFWYDIFGHLLSLKDKLQPTNNDKTSTVQLEK